MNVKSNQNDLRGIVLAKKGPWVVEKFLLILIVCVSALLAVHALLTKLCMERLYLSWFESACMSAIILMLAIYIYARSNRKLDRQIDNFVYFKGKRHYRDLLGEAMHDGLTGLYNHKYFLIILEQELERAKRYGRPLSMLMMDVDHFKQYNDTNGHLEGDKALAGLGVVLRHFSRQVDIIARYGGEEFAMLLPETDRAGARTMAERMRKYVEETQSAGVGVTISIGIGYLDGTDKQVSRDDFIKLADDALYRAKEAGRNRVAV